LLSGLHHGRPLCPFSPSRSNYIAAWHAAKMMVPAKQGLIVNVSSSGGMTYLFNVAYGVGKAAVSRTSLYALKNEKKLPGLFFAGIHKIFPLASHDDAKRLMLSKSVCY